MMDAVVVLLVLGVVLAGLLIMARGFLRWLRGLVVGIIREGVHGKQGD